MAITVSNRGAITELPTVAVHNMAAAVGISTVMVPPTVTLNKHRNRRHSRRRTVSGNGSGRGITWFAPASEHKRRWRHPNARSFLSAPRQAPHAAIRRGGSRRLGPWHLQHLGIGRAPAVTTRRIRARLELTASRLTSKPPTSCRRTSLVVCRARRSL